jgi:hypothetical protein
MSRPRTNQRKKAKAMTIAQGMETWISNIQDTLLNLNKPNVTAEQKEMLKQHLRYVLNEAIVQIQENLLMPNGLLAADPYGFTKGKTAWSSEASKKANPYSYLIDEYCQEILKEQEAKAEEAGSIVDEQSLIDAKIDSEDNEKKSFEIKTTGSDKEGGGKLVVDKETGDAILYQTEADGSQRKVGFLARWWRKGVDFVKFILGWLWETCKAGYNYIVSKFSFKDKQAA